MEGQEMVKPKKTRAKYEWLIILIVIVASVVVALGIYRARNKAVKGQLLISELSQMRAAIATYKTLNKVNPPDLVSLTKMTFSFATGEQPKSYLSNLEVSEKGEIADPFGNLYKYDAGKAWVVSTTEGCEKW